MADPAVPPPSAPPSPPPAAPDTADEEGRRETDVACTVCGCVCDDLELEVRGDRFAAAGGTCPLSEPWFVQLDAARPPICEINGRPATLENGLAHAAGLLAESRAPLIFGLARSSTPGQRAAIALADQLGGTLDTTASVCHGPSIMAIQTVGESTSTLGEVRHRADLVIFWGADPVHSHPRHFERYSLDVAGDLVPNGRADRTLVVVDVEETDTARRADLFVRVDPRRDFEALSWLRGRLAGVLPEDAPLPDGVHGEGLRTLERLAAECRFGAVFFGLGVARSPLGHLTVESLLSWVAELHRRTRFVARRLRVPGDVSGADSVLCWQAGYPFAVDFSRGVPRYEPGEYSADGRLGRGEVDALLLVGSESIPELTAEARSAITELPVIALDHPHQSTTVPAAVRFTTAVHGVHAAGTAYRMDEVPIPLRAHVPTEYPTDEEVLGQLAARLATSH